MRPHTDSGLAVRSQPPRASSTSSETQALPPHLFINAKWSAVCKFQETAIMWRHREQALRCSIRRQLPDAPDAEATPLRAAGGTRSAVRGVWAGIRLNAGNARPPSAASASAQNWRGSRFQGGKWAQVSSPRFAS